VLSGIGGDHSIMRVEGVIFALSKSLECARKNSYSSALPAKKSKQGNSCRRHKNAPND
jgi:hypothetical protein